MPAGAVTEQRYEAEVDGEPTSLRNVLLTLPGDANSTVLVVAARDADAGPGAASSAAATGILVELANAFRVSHEKTFVLASVSGSTVGGAGVRELIDGLAGARDDRGRRGDLATRRRRAPRGPSWSPARPATSSAPSQLERTAERAVEVQAEARSGEDGAFTQLARIALPSGLGDQAVLIGEGTGAVAISSAGERPLAAADDQPDDVSPQSDRRVRAGGAVDGRRRRRRGRRAGPRARDLRRARRQPAAGMGAGDARPGVVRPGRGRGRRRLRPSGSRAPRDRRRARLGRGAQPAVRRGAGDPLSARVAGAVPRPPFPFDPSLYELGTRAAISFGAMALIAVASAWLLRIRGVTGTRAPEAAACGLGAVTVAAWGLLWLVNPYLALLVVPIVHLWLLAFGPRTVWRRVAIIGLAALACVPLAAAFAAVSRALDLGVDAPWTFAIMVADGQIGFATALALCFLGGAVIGTAALALARPADRG